MKTLRNVLLRIPGGIVTVLVTYLIMWVWTVVPWKNDWVTATTVGAILIGHRIGSVVDVLVGGFYIGAKNPDRVSSIKDLLDIL